MKPVLYHPRNWPIVDHPLYLWLLDQEKDGERVTLTLKECVGHLSQFYEIPVEHRLDLRHVVNAYHDFWMPTRKEECLTSLFTSERTSQRYQNSSYWLRDGKKLLVSDRVQLTQQLMDLLSKLPMIYDLSPETYYFEVVNGHLFIKCQQILSSKRVCKLALD